MLVLSRRSQEVIWIGGNIQIKVLSVEKGHVNLGIDAPKQIAVYREELLTRNKKIDNDIKSYVRV